MTKEDLKALAEDWIKPEYQIWGYDSHAKALATDYLRLLAQEEARGEVVCEHGTAVDVHCCNCHSGFLFDPHHECPPSMADAAEMLWTVIANVSEGNWTKQTPEWQEAAARWRDYYFAARGDMHRGDSQEPSLSAAKQCDRECQCGYPHTGTAE